MKAEGPTQAELDKVRKNWHLNFDRSKEQNGFWLGLLQSAEIDREDPRAMLKAVDDADRLTPADICQAAQRFFDTDNYVQVLLNLKKAAVASVAPSR